MRWTRAAVVLLLLLVWGAFVPLAMAVDHCAAMGGVCEGPCAASATVTSPVVPAATELVSRAPVEPGLPVAQLEPSSLEPPPKSLLLPA
jgi:hypothetical protein